MKARIQQIDVQIGPVVDCTTLDRKSVLITGPSGAGKTTRLSGALLFALERSNPALSPGHRAAVEIRLDIGGTELVLSRESSARKRGKTSGLYADLSSAFAYSAGTWFRDRWGTLAGRREIRALLEGLLDPPPDRAELAERRGMIWYDTVPDDDLTAASKACTKEIRAGNQRVAELRAALAEVEAWLAEHPVPEQDLAAIDEAKIRANELRAELQTEREVRTRNSERVAARLRRSALLASTVEIQGRQELRKRLLSDLGPEPSVEDEELALRAARASLRGLVGDLEHARAAHEERTALWASEECPVDVPADPGPFLEPAPKVVKCPKCGTTIGGEEDACAWRQRGDNWTAKRKEALLAIERAEKAMEEWHTDHEDASPGAFEPAGDLLRRIEAAQTDVTAAELAYKAAFSALMIWRTNCDQVPPAEVVPSPGPEVPEDDPVGREPNDIAIDLAEAEETLRSVQLATEVAANTAMERERLEQRARVLKLDIDDQRHELEGLAQLAEWIRHDLPALEDEHFSAQLRSVIPVASRITVLLSQKTASGGRAPGFEATLGGVPMTDLSHGEGVFLDLWLRWAATTLGRHDVPMCVDDLPERFWACELPPTQILATCERGGDLRNGRFP